ncbi:MAG: hypothetical protein ACE5K7_01890 [Phycisphaerae bacterium]
MSDLLALLGQEGRLTIGGAIVMTLSVGFVLALVIFCVLRIFREPRPEQRMHAPLDIDTHDSQAQPHDKGSGDCQHQRLPK